MGLKVKGQKSAKILHHDLSRTEKTDTADADRAEEQELLTRDDIDEL